MTNNLLQHLLNIEYNDKCIEEIQETHYFLIYTFISI
jgi:hypothetical protein